MSKFSEKKAQKRKQRERRVQEKLYARRMAKMKEDKHKREVDRQVWMSREKGLTFKKVNTKKPEEIQAQLEKNLKILQELQAADDAERAARSELNRKLEEEGAKTIREKMEALAKNAGTENLLGKTE